MWANMSKDSINRVSRVHPTEEHNAICQVMDAQALLTRIRQSHQGAGALIQALNWEASSMTSYLTHQEPHKEISDYKHRFDASVRAMTVVNHPGIPNGELQAAHFLSTLCKRKI